MGFIFSIGDAQGEQAGERAGRYAPLHLPIPPSIVSRDGVRARVHSQCNTHGRRGYRLLENILRSDERNGRGRHERGERGSRVVKTVDAERHCQGK